jgi:hypothetical protein
VSAVGREHRRRGGRSSQLADCGAAATTSATWASARGATVNQGRERDGNRRGGRGVGDERGGGACPGTPRWCATRPAQEPPDWLNGDTDVGG